MRVMIIITNVSQELGLLLGFARDFFELRLVKEFLVIAHFSMTISSQILP
jgi:hypothetical protein